MYAQVQAENLCARGDHVVFLRGHGDGETVQRRPRTGVVLREQSIAVLQPVVDTGMAVDKEVLQMGQRVNNVSDGLHCILYRLGIVST